MKKIIVILIALLPLTLSGQQFPFMEGYNINPYNLLPAFAGLHNTKTVFVDYRSDWSGLDGGPRTYQLSYNDRYGDRVGVGGKFIYDKTDIFKQMLFLATYSYELTIKKDNLINLALSAGLFKNSIDLGKYYNNPEYVQDLVLLYGSDKSKMKVATDISALFHNKQVEAGLLFSNIMFGSARYKNSSMTYKPLKNYQLFASYLFTIDDKWAIKPTVVFRGGQNVPPQLEIAPAVNWNKRFWMSAVYRTGGIFGAAFGGEVYKGLMINYSYNLSTNVAMNTFGSHQITLGVRIIQPAQNIKQASK